MPDADISRLKTAVRERGKPFRILVVDDEEWVRDVFRDFCKVAETFEVDIAGGGNEALNMMRASTYDLVTLDLIMPEMSGLEVLMAIGDMAARIPVRVITGNATDKLVDRAGVLGANRVIYKPVRLESFIAEVASALLR